MSQKFLPFESSSAGSPDARRPGTGLFRWTACGNSRALAAFYDRWSAGVYALVSDLITDPDEIEQVVEATFWHAWQAASTYDADVSSVSDWLTKIVRRKSVEHFRLKRQGRMALLALANRPMLQVADPGSETELLASVIPDADLCDGLRKAVEAAALHDAKSMKALRGAVQEFTVSLRDEGLTPDGVLMSLNTIINQETLSNHVQYPLEWESNQLPNIVSAWSVVDFYSSRR